MKKNEKHLDKYKWNLASLIGEGESSKVYSGINKITCHPVAIKIIELKYISDEYLMKDLGEDLKILKTIKSENIVQIFDVFFTKSYFYIIEELCSENLETHLCQKEKRSENDVIFILAQVLNAFHIFKLKNLIHGNLNPRNILFSEGKWKVSDYYFKKIVYCCKYQNRIPEETFLHIYRSPELIQNGLIAEKCDIWSFGLLFYRLSFGCLPWNEENMKTYLKMIHRTKMKFPENCVISKESKEIMRKCIEIDKNKRISFKELFSHQYFKKLFSNVEIHTVLEMENIAKALLINLTKTITENKINIEQLFNRFDSSGDKSLDLDEFALLLKVIDPTIPQKGIQNVFDKIDIERNNFITLAAMKKTFKHENEIVVEFYEDPLLEEKALHVRYILTETIEKNNIDILSLFKNYDHTGDQTLDYNEFQKFVKDISPSMKPEEIQYLFARLDTDKSGDINIYEFKAYIIGSEASRKKIMELDRKAENTFQFLKKLIYEQQMDVRKLFSNFDFERNGTIRISDFHQMVTIINDKLDFEEISYMFKKIDKDGSGVVDYREFIEKLL